MNKSQASPPFASIATQTTIFSAFTAAFTKTKLMIRYPDVKGTIPTASLGMEYHDDSFTQATLTAHSYFFYARMIIANATNQWAALSNWCRSQAIILDLYLRREYKRIVC